MEIYDAPEFGLIFIYYFPKKIMTHKYILTHYIIDVEQFKPL